MATLTNSRSGESVETKFSNIEAAEIFAELPGNDWMWFWIHKMVNEATAPSLADALDVLQKMFLVAVGAGLKMPKIILDYKGVRIRFYLSARGTVCLKQSLRIGDTNQFGEWVYIGNLWGGQYRPRRGYNPIASDAEELIGVLSESDDVVNLLADLSKESNSCCYCGFELSDEESKHRGYGKTCAKNWGLPYGKRAYSVPSIPSLFNDKMMMGFMDSVIADINNPFAWEVLSDYINEMGNESRLSPPKPGARIPAFTQAQ